MAGRRRHSTIITDDLPRKNHDSEYDFVNRSQEESILSLQGYHYRLDGYYVRRSAKSIDTVDNTQSLIETDTKPESSSANSSPRTPRRSNLRTEDMTPTPAKAWSNLQKPRTVKQQKNKKRQKEMEKEFSKNERWRCLSEGPPVDHTRYQQVTIIPLSYDERAVDCEGLDESHPKDRGYHGFNSFQSASSMLSIPTTLDSPVFQKTKPKRSRFRPLSSIFSRKSNSPSNLNAAISELDLVRWATFQQLSPQQKRASLFKAKSAIDLPTMLSSSSKNVHQVTLFGRPSDPRQHKFSTTTDDFRKRFVEGWWTAPSPKSGRPPLPMPESKPACKSVDSGYDSPEIAQKISTTDSVTDGPKVEKAVLEKAVPAYGPFDSRKASLFNEYFANQGGQLEAETGEEVYSQIEAAEAKSEPTVEKVMPDHNDEVPSDQPDRPEAAPAPKVPPRNRSTSQNDASVDTFENPSPKTDDPTKATATPSNDKTLPIVVAIDFGTSFSGYAYAFREKGADRVYVMRRLTTNDPGASSPKCPTCLLLEPDGRFHSFGWEARDAYHDLEPELARRYLYFESFKMVLDSEKTLKQRSKIAALNGTLWPAIDVLAHCLRYLKRHALIEMSECTSVMVNPAHVQWVVTVPAIWRQSAKQLTRMAAYQAGMGSPERFHQLIIALEPEAASVYCTQLKQNEILPHLSPPRVFFSLPSSLRESGVSGRKIDRTDLQAVQLSPGNAYMVVDCGGGTVDLTVHRPTESGDIVELHKASGGPHGSTEIDQAFRFLLSDIFSADFLDAFRTRYPAAFVDLMLAFETRKRAAHPYKSNPFNIALPFSFLEYYKKKFGHRVECAVKRYEKKQHISWNSQGMLRLSAEMMTYLFMPTLVAIVKLIDEAIEAVQPVDLSYLFLVGGFAESPLLQHEIRNAFESRMKIIIPNQASTAVLRGAVLYGLRPDRISARRSRKTYGISVLHPFDPSQHPTEKRVSKNGRDWCKDIFEKFVTTNESITFDQDMVRHYCPSSTDQTQIQIQIFSTDSPNPRFVTDPGVERCGVLKIDLPKVSRGDTKEGVREKEIKASVRFGGTELVLDAVDVFSGEPVNGCIDFLS